MNAAAYRDHESRLPALIAAVALHLGVLALVVLVPSKPPMLPIGSSVPINIVSSDTLTNTRPAVEAPQVQAAAAPAPTPEAPPQPPAAELAPPAFSPEPRVAPQRQKPAPPQPSINAQAAPAQPSLDFNRLQQVIESARHSGGAQASSAPRGPPRVETDTHTRPNAGRGLSQSNMLGLQQLLERLWNPNCDVPGGSSVWLQVRFKVDSGGQVPRGDEPGHPVVLGGLDNAVFAAAARRAIDAVHQAAPYAEPYYGQAITVNFDAKEACSKR